MDPRTVILIELGIVGVLTISLYRIGKNIRKSMTSIKQVQTEINSKITNDY